MRKRVVITGIGTVCPVGNDAVSAWENILAGKSGVNLVTLFDSSQFKTRIAAEVKDFDAKALLGRREARRYDRVSQLAIVATQQAVEQSGLEITDENRNRVGVLIGSGIGGITTLYESILVYLDRGPITGEPLHRPNDAARFPIRVGCNPLWRSWPQYGHRHGLRHRHQFDWRSNRNDPTRCCRRYVSWQC